MKTAMQELIERLDMTEIGICPDCLEYCDWEEVKQEIEKL